MNRYRVKVWGKYACFSYPGMVERTTYPLMTPTAAAGALRAIFGKEAFEWAVLSVGVVRRGREMALRRNELKFLGAFEAPKSIEAQRTQRRTTLLHDVAYIIEARMHFLPGRESDYVKDRDQFERRLKRGQCYDRPYLGCREFGAYFCEPDGTEVLEDWTQDLGQMLLEVDFRPQRAPRTEPRFFHATVEKGLMRVPDWRAERDRAVN